ncbi:hypothetical protein COEREDRAFT_88751 [Coemansia reversa NRRL 1564]|uniref:VanZ-like domain-containing protein n=1 Tax=Coemansia reversa (strain ATCC 12441 / NRRL 1564) TaxID=763665 RepID=A0A2G5B5T8_COERN|nr:hypothetical protein COEREDRAFT_88751 [Coemansia reversa NRRL 1564]|eukprot:PIA14361.1 hypothetical protein COEREDRAFT_88751 [Coemansia reversa NRRL 1564]
MWRVPLAARLRLPVTIALTIWMTLLALLGFTHLLRPPVSDKALHFVGFGVMGVLVFFSFQSNIPRTKAWTITGGLMAVVCFFSEVVQRILTTRPFQWSDIASNFLGALTFLFAAWMADTWIIQPRAGVSAYQDSPRYWALNSGHRDQLSVDLELEDDLGLELNDILVDSPTQELSRASTPQLVP